MTQIFLSHSSQDGAFANVLATEIERGFDDQLKVFASTRPDAIPGGMDWFEVVMENLDKADALIILITEPSVNSVWVGFEVGYFWKQMNGNRIFALYHPSVSIPSPLNTRQAKKLTEPSELESFFDSLCSSLGKVGCKDFGVERLARAAASIVPIPPDRSLARFEQYLKTSSWDRVLDGNVETWICEEDVLFQIVVDYSLDDDRELDEEWTRPFPASMLGGDKASAYPVKLKIANVTMKAFRFVSVDGGRYFVPIPEIEAIAGQEGKRRFYWERGSLIYMTAQIVSCFYHVHPSFEEFAKHAGIEIR